MTLTGSEPVIASSKPCSSFRSIGSLGFFPFNFLLYVRVVAALFSRQMGHLVLFFSVSG